MKKQIFNLKHKKGLNSAIMKQALHEIPKTLSKTRNPSLTLPPAEEIEEESDNSQGEGIKITIPSYIIEFCTRVEVLLQ